MFDDFLTKVIEQNSDEFEGPDNVVARYKTLKESNERLKRSARTQEQEVESITERASAYQNEQSMRQVKMVNSIANKQKDLEVLDQDKEKIMASNEETTSAILQQTCEHG